MIDYDEYLAHPKLKKYIEELLLWNKKINLIGKSTEKTLIETHIYDSIELLALIKNIGINLIIDIGSGNGIPAIPLSIFMPEKKIILTDVITKKITFLNYIILSLNLNAEVVDVSKGYINNNECIITSRAYSSLSEIIRWKNKHSPNTKKFYIFKGNEDNINKEIEEAKITNYKINKIKRGYIIEF